MQKCPVLEHSEVNRLLRKQERVKGSVPVYTVKINEGSVCTSFAAMPALEEDVYKIDTDGYNGFLVMNTMDDYARYQVVPEELLAKPPEFVNNATPMADQARLDAEKEDARIKQYMAEQEERHKNYFELASRINASVGDVCDIPATWEEYRDAMSIDDFHKIPVSVGLYRLDDAIHQFRGVTGIEPSRISFGDKDTPMLRAMKALKNVQKELFEKQHDFSVDSKFIDDLTIQMRVINPNGAVLESAKVSLMPGLAMINENAEDIASLDLLGDDTEYFRMGKRIDGDESLLQAILAEYEEGFFELSKGPVPDLDAEFTDDGEEIYSVSDLGGLPLYETLRTNFPDTIAKFSLMSKASMRRTQEINNSRSEKGLGVS